MECGEAMTTENVLTQLREFGRFQKLILLLLWLMLIPSHFQLYMNQLLLATPSWKCSNGSELCPFNETMAGDDRSRCELPRGDWRYTEGHKYSLVTHFELDCEREWLQGLLTILLYAGVAAGALTLGWLCDVRGRKDVLFYSFFILLMTTFMRTFLHDIRFLLVSQFLAGFFYPGVLLPSLLLVAELFNKRHRSSVILLLLSSLPASSLLLLLQAYYCRQWRAVAIVCSLPYTSLLLFYIVIPESVRWLQSRDRPDDVMVILKRVAQWNRRRISDDVLVIQDTCGHREVVQNMTPMFRRPVVSALKVLVLCVLWTVVYMQYYCDSLLVEGMGSTVYQSMLIFNSIELPMRLAAILVCNTMGRKKSVLIPLILSTLTFLIVPSITDRMRVLTMIIGTIGKLCITVCASTVVAWSVELCSVGVRGRMFGAFYLLSLIIPLATPWMNISLKQLGRGYLCFVVAAVSVFACCASVALPDDEERRDTCVSRSHAMDEDEGEYHEQIRLTKHVVTDVL